MTTRSAITRPAAAALAIAAAVVLQMSPSATAVPLAGAPHPRAAVPVTPRPATPRYLTPTAVITPAKGCIVLTPGMNGVKVKLVQRRLGFPPATWETMDASTIARVKSFQRSRHMTADGVVGPATWKALGIREDFCMDRWQARPVLPLSATPARRTEEFISYASSYLGAEYVWGGAGTPRYGVDCSGLVLQSLYSAGLDPQPISIDRHVQPTYRTSLQLYGYARLLHLPLSSAKRGDLVFYRSNSTGKVNHVAIYLGDNRLLEAKGTNVHVSPLRRTLPTQTLMPLVVRPFA